MKKIILGICYNDLEMADEQGIASIGAYLEQFNYDVISYISKRWKFIWR